MFQSTKDMTAMVDLQFLFIPERDRMAVRSGLDEANRAIQANFAAFDMKKLYLNATRLRPLGDRKDKAVADA